LYATHALLLPFHSMPLSQTQQHKNPKYIGKAGRVQILSWEKETKQTDLNTVIEQETTSAPLVGLEKAEKAENAIMTPMGYNLHKNNAKRQINAVEVVNERNGMIQRSLR
jgi:hypothetical protein